MGGKVRRKYRVKLPRAYPDRVRRCAVEDQLPLLQYACNNLTTSSNYGGTIFIGRRGYKFRTWRYFDKNYNRDIFLFIISETIIVISTDLIESEDISANIDVRWICSEKTNIHEIKKSILQFKRNWFFWQYVTSGTIYKTKGGSNVGKNLPGELTCRFPALMICKVHRPSAFSPQKCTLRKGQSSKFELRTSRGRSNNSVEVVPIGEVNKSLKFPRGKNLRETYFIIGNLSFIVLKWHQKIADTSYVLLCHIFFTINVNKL